MSGVPTYVMDASVALKWYLPEPDAERAELLLQAAAQGVVELVAPELLLLEAANVCWKRVRRQELSPDDALAILERLGQVPMRWIGDGELAPAALHLALTVGCTAYNAAYVVLAQALPAALVTADAKLVALCAEAGLGERVLPLLTVEL